MSVRVVRMFMLASVWPMFVACAPLVTSGESSGGTWAVEVEDPTLPVGDAPLALRVAAGGAPAAGLQILLRADMEGMAHGASRADAEDQGDGRYLAELPLTMEGVWRLQGTIDDGAASESFALEIAAEGL